MKHFTTKKLAIVFSLIVSISYTALALQTPSSKLNKIQSIIDKATQGKLQGVLVSIESPEHGKWIVKSGFANAETKTLIDKKAIFSLASIGKTYTAVTVLKLVEEGKLQLDDKIQKYLPKEIINGLPNAEKVTVKQLLGHTSGFYNYNANPELNELYLSGSLKLDTLSHINALRRYAYGKTYPRAIYGMYNYCSTNYLLLAMIMDNILPEGHIKFVRDLLKQHNFKNTYYKQLPKFSDLQYYGDIDLDEKLENLTKQTIETTNWYCGDDGMYATIDDATSFLKKLMKGKILGKKVLKEMMMWNDDKNPDYGLGLMADKGFPYKLSIGHSGRGIGITTDLYYFPDKEMTIAIFCNTGLRSASPVFKKEYNKMRNKIIKRLF
ncbi:serine hydrolase domain-containing protein [Winogradskyella haliclonae]|uniref:Serine-type D-Ala-D-Ala carboxypeptidase n=1 Tax=Winogradskyella haliclonae TaxID=2048558 RepID=A0ABQ2BW54_9FLAO|nr:serine hydrolase domain-containing protein [Winogradskyella haliclonae]GGI56726.1 serine-type D-Ala-D-Ala carboxypeptidase [Winogradskyella haliclonae]